MLGFWRRCLTSGAAVHIWRCVQIVETDPAGKGQYAALPVAGVPGDPGCNGTLTPGADCDAHLLINRVVQ